MSALTESGPAGAAAPHGPAAPVDAGLVSRVRARLADTGAPPTPTRVAAALRAEGRVLGDAVVLGVVTMLRSELAGAGPLEALLHDPRVTDVLVNAPDEVWVDRGAGLERAAVAFPDDAAVRRLAQRLVAAAGRRLDDACPYADARLPDGTRLHAVLHPVATRATTLSLRVPRRLTFTLSELVAAGSLTADGAAWLSALVRGRLAFLVSGGTGTGKTTPCLVLPLPRAETGSEVPQNLRGPRRSRAGGRAAGPGP